MEPIFIRKLNRKERDFLYELIEDKKIGYRAKIIILSYEGYTPPQIEKAINMHVRNVRKWIHRFNEKGIKGILTKKRPGRKPRINEKIIKEATKSSLREAEIKYSKLICKERIDHSVIHYWEKKFDSNLIERLVKNLGNKIEKILDYAFSILDSTKFTS